MTRQLRTSAHDCMNVLCPEGINRKTVLLPIAHHPPAQLPTPPTSLLHLSCPKQVSTTEKSSLDTAWQREIFQSASSLCKGYIFVKHILPKWLILISGHDFLWVPISGHDFLSVLILFQVHFAGGIWGKEFTSSARDGWVHLLCMSASCWVSTPNDEGLWLQI